MAKKKPRISALEEDFLTLLSGVQDAYGLDMLARLNVGRAYPILVGSLYPALKNLERKGLVKCCWGEDEGAGGRRKYYRITKEGRSALEALQQYRRSLVAGVGEFGGKA